MGNLADARAAAAAANATPPLDPKAKGISSVRAALDFATNNKSLYGTEVTVVSGSIQYTGTILQTSNDMLVLRRETRTTIIDGENAGKKPVGYTFVEMRSITSITFEIAES